MTGTKGTKGAKGPEGIEGIESLYPFLYAGEANLAAVVEEVRRSTEEKTAEIVALRREMGQRYAGELLLCAEAMAERFASGGKLFAFGNGGSSSDAQAVATTFMAPGPAAIGLGARALPAIALTADIAVVTALSNDIGFEVIFARQLAAFGRPGDIAVGLSTSGGSANVLRGFEEASRRGMLTVGLAGYDGGKMAELDAIEHLFVVPSSSVHRIQEAQTTLYHVLWELTQQALAAR
ncbi:MAG: D-sedoheptulose-7-phosphate isomerase [Actinomycetes bacterium]